MADVNVTLKPVVAIDATTQFPATKMVNGVRTVVQIAQSDLKGLDGKSSIAVIGGTPPAIPSVGVQVQYTVDSSAGFIVDQIVSVGSAATLKVVSIPATTSIVLENADAPVGPVAVGTKILPSGKRGLAGANGLDSTVPGPAGANAFTTVITGFTIPAYNAQVTVTVGSTTFMAVDQSLQISGKFFRVFTAPTNATTVVLTNSVLGQSGIIAQFAKIAVAGEAGPAGSPGSGVSGLQYTNLNTAGTPLAGQIRSADINYVGASPVSISATDAQATPQSTADVLARLKVGAIIEIAASNANKVRGTISANYSSGTNSFNWDSQIVSGSIANNTTVYLSIISDPVSAGGGGQVQDEGVNLPIRSKTNFVGAGVTATDDAAGDRTVVTITGGSSGSVVNLPYQSSDPVAVAGTLLLFARADGSPFARKADGSVYPLSLGPAVPPIDLGAYLIDDNFTGAPGTPLIGRAPDTVGTMLWQAVGADGGFTIQTTGAVTDTGVNLVRRVTINPSISYTAVTAKLRMPANATTYAGIVLYTNAANANTNYISLGFNNNLVTLSRGTAQSVNSAFVLSGTSDINISVTKTGNIFTATINNLITLTLDITGNSLDANAFYIGLYSDANTNTTFKKLTCL
jgi:hypothetical protein